jgi:methionine-rich copper-binding protein CopC
MGGRVLRLTGWLVTVGVALGVSLWSAAPAAAHNSLTGSDPADGARLAQAPTWIELRFLARLDPNTTKITITGPDGVPASRGTSTVDGSRVRVAFDPGPAGLYLVGYRITSSDGHPVTGEIRFTLTTGTPTDPSSAAGTPTVTGAASPRPADAAPPQPVGTAAVPAAEPASGSRDADGWPGGVWVFGAVALLAALAGGGLALRRRSGTR